MLRTALLSLLSLLLLAALAPSPVLAQSRADEDAEQFLRQAMAAKRSEPGWKFVGVDADHIVFRPAIRVEPGVYKVRPHAGDSDQAFYDENGDGVFEVSKYDETKTRLLNFYIVVPGFESREIYVETHHEGETGSAVTSHYFRDLTVRAVDQPNKRPDKTFTVALRPLLTNNNPNCGSRWINAPVEPPRRLATHALLLAGDDVCADESVAGAESADTGDAATPLPQVVPPQSSEPIRLSVRQMGDNCAPVTTSEHTKPSAAYLVTRGCESGEPLQFQLWHQDSPNDFADQSKVLQGSDVPEVTIDELDRNYVVEPLYSGQTRGYSFPDIPLSAENLQSLAQREEQVARIIVPSFARPPALRKGSIYVFPEDPLSRSLHLFNLTLLPDLDKGGKWDCGEARGTEPKISNRFVLEEAFGVPKGSWPIVRLEPATAQGIDPRYLWAEPKELNGVRSNVYEQRGHAEQLDEADFAIPLMPCGGALPGRQQVAEVEESADSAEDAALPESLAQTDVMTETAGNTQEGQHAEVRAELTYGGEPHLWPEGVKANPDDALKLDSADRSIAVLSASEGESRVTLFYPADGCPDGMALRNEPSVDVSLDLPEQTLEVEGFCIARRNLTIALDPAWSYEPPEDVEKGACIEHLDDKRLDGRTQAAFCYESAMLGKLDFEREHKAGIYQDDTQSVEITDRDLEGDGIIIAPEKAGSYRDGYLRLLVKWPEGAEPRDLELTANDQNSDNDWDVGAAVTFPYDPDDENVRFELTWSGPEGLRLAENGLKQADGTLIPHTIARSGQIIWSMPFDGRPTTPPEDPDVTLELEEAPVSLVGLQVRLSTRVAGESYTEPLCRPGLEVDDSRDVVWLNLARAGLWEVPDDEEMRKSLESAAPSSKLLVRSAAIESSSDATPVRDDTIEASRQVCEDGVAWEGTVRDVLDGDPIEAVAATKPPVLVYLSRTDASEERYGKYTQNEIPEAIIETVTSLVEGGRYLEIAQADDLAADPILPHEDIYPTARRKSSNELAKRLTVVRGVIPGLESGLPDVLEHAASRADAYGGSAETDRIVADIVYAYLDGDEITEARIERICTGIQRKAEALATRPPRSLTLLIDTKLKLAFGNETAVDCEFDDSEFPMRAVLTNLGTLLELGENLPEDKWKAVLSGQFGGTS